MCTNNVIVHREHPEVVQPLKLDHCCCCSLYHCIKFIDFRKKYSKKIIIRGRIWKLIMFLIILGFPYIALFSLLYLLQQWAHKDIKRVFLSRLSQRNTSTTWKVNTRWKQLQQNVPSISVPHQRESSYGVWIHHLSQPRRGNPYARVTGSTHYWAEWVVWSHYGWGRAEWESCTDVAVQGRNIVGKSRNLFLTGLLRRLTWHIYPKEVGSSARLTRCNS